MSVLLGIMVPFIGTALGAGCVFLLKDEMSAQSSENFAGICLRRNGGGRPSWSLLMPAMDMSEAMGKLAFIPAAAGFVLGIAFLLVLDMLVPHLHMDHDEPEGIRKAVEPFDYDGAGGDASQYTRRYGGGRCVCGDACAGYIHYFDRGICIVYWDSDPEFPRRGQLFLCR